jgi:hypothetical protein
MPPSARSVGRRGGCCRAWSAVALALGALAAPAVVEAWPAIQDDQGQVFLCDTRPAQLMDGRWACRSAGVNLVGGLVDVVRPGTPPGSRPWGGPPGPPGRWWGPAPWVRPPNEPSGYDALDPWLGGGNSSER